MEADGDGITNPHLFGPDSLRMGLKKESSFFRPIFYVICILNRFWLLEGKIDENLPTSWYLWIHLKSYLCYTLHNLEVLTLCRRLSPSEKLRIG